MPWQVRLPPLDGAGDRAPVPGETQSIRWSLGLGQPIPRGGELRRVFANRVELQALETEAERAAAEAEMANLRATLQKEELGQRSFVASIRAELSTSEARAKADAELARQGFLSSELQLPASPLCAIAAVTSPWQPR